MCDIDDGHPDFFVSKWRRSRKQHTCCACYEAIQRGDFYRYTSGCWDGMVESFKHCPRCWKMMIAVQEVTGEQVEITLNCGADPLDPGEHPETSYLAFLTREEAQVFAERDSAGQSTKGQST